MFQNISLLDGGIVLGYFAIVFLLAWWVTMRERRAKKENYGSSDYFLGGKNVGWFVIGASLFASNIGSEHLVGLAGSGAKGEMVAGQFEILAALILILLGWVFVPFYLKSGVFTMPEFLEKRYNPQARNYLSIVSIVAYILTKISLTIFAGALVFEVMGLSFWTGAIIVVLATGVYTVLGGLRAVIYTDMMQMFVFLGGAIAIVYFGLDALDGWEGMKATIAAAAEADPKLEATNFLSLWRPGDDPNYPWTGIIFGAPILGIWYWCTDQVIVQKVLSAHNLSEARKGTLFAGFLKLTPLFIFIIPGVIAFALAQKGMLTLNAPDEALPALVTQFLPTGVKGLVLAGLLAALMSSLSSVFNSCSTLFTIDFYKKWRPAASEKQLVWVGQVVTAVLVVLSLAWIPILRTMLSSGENSFYKVLQSIQAYISPPIAAAFLLGLFIPRLNGRGAIWALWTGFFLGMARLALEILMTEGMVVFTEGSFLHFMITMNFLHFAIVLFLISSVVMILVSLTSPAPLAAQLENVTYKRPEAGQRFLTFSKPEVWLTFLLIAAVVALWLLF